MFGRQVKSLEELRELVRIVSSLLPTEPQVLTPTQFKVSSRRTAELYRQIRDNPNATDEQLFRILEHRAGIRSEQSKPVARKRLSYPKVKSRLKGLLINNLFLLDPNQAGHSDFSTVQFAVHKMAFISRILGHFGARSFAVTIAEHGLAKAHQIEDWYSSMGFLFILRANASQIGSKRSHELYFREFQHCLNLFSAEHEAECEVERVQLLFAKSSEEKPEIAALVEGSAQRVEKIAGEHPSFKLGSLAIRLKAISAEVRLDYRATIELCNEAKALLERYPIFSNRARRAEYAIQTLLSAVQLREWKIAADAVRDCNENFKGKETNWFLFKEWEFVLLMQTLRFKEAYDVCALITNHTRFSGLPEGIREKWNLFLQYSQLVTNRPILNLSIDELNAQVPDLANDKAGHNTSLILLHLLVLADQKQFHSLRDRMEFIKGYRKRFLKGKQNSQASHFFNMLALMETCDLNHKKILKKSISEIVELERIEKEEPIQGEQILPFSWIWNRLMERLAEYHPLAHTE